MGNISAGRRLIACAVLGGLSLLLSGCFFSAGRFTSALDLQKNGQFTFTYAGELFFLPLADKVEESQAQFQPDTCYDDDYDERECTAEELAEQKQVWQDRQDEMAANKQREAAQAARLLGGIDPSDPRADEEFADLLRRQAGWQTVIAKGNGLFEVEYRVTSTLGHPFTFPAVEGFTMSNELVSLTPRADGTVRINAPGFGPASESPMGAMGAMMGGVGGPSADSDSSKPPVMDGHFTITTDGAILANNTDTGPQSAPDGRRTLSWTANVRTKATPTALIQLER